jgi:hypothetical protein
MQSMQACKYMSIRTIPIALEPSGLETAGCQTILTFPLFSIAEAEGTKSIQRSPGQFLHPLRDPTLPIEEDQR